MHLKYSRAGTFPLFKSKGFGKEKINKTLQKNLKKFNFSLKCKFSINFIEKID